MCGVSRRGEGRCGARGRAARRPGGCAAAAGARASTRAGSATARGRRSPGGAKRPAWAIAAHLIGPTYRGAKPCACEGRGAHARGRHPRALPAALTTAVSPPPSPAPRTPVTIPTLHVLASPRRPPPSAHHVRYNAGHHAFLPLVPRIHQRDRPQSGGRAVAAKHGRTPRLRHVLGADRVERLEHVGRRQRGLGWVERVWGSQLCNTGRAKVRAQGAGGGSTPGAACRRGASLRCRGARGRRAPAASPRFRRRASPAAARPRWCRPTAPPALARPTVGWWRR